MVEKFVKMVEKFIWTFCQKNGRKIYGEQIVRKIVENGRNW